MGNRLISLSILGMLWLVPVGSVAAQFSFATPRDKVPTYFDPSWGQYNPNEFDGFGGSGFNPGMPGDGHWGHLTPPTPVIPRFDAINGGVPGVSAPPYQQPYQPQPYQQQPYQPQPYQQQPYQQQPYQQPAPPPHQLPPYQQSEPPLYQPNVPYPPQQQLPTYPAPRPPVYPYGPGSQPAPFSQSYPYAPNQPSQPQQPPMQPDPRVMPVPPSYPPLVVPPESAAPAGPRYPAPPGIDGVNPADLPFPPATSTPGPYSPDRPALTPPPASSLPGEPPLLSPPPYSQGASQQPFPGTAANGQPSQSGQQGIGQDTSRDVAERDKSSAPHKGESSPSAGKEEVAYLPDPEDTESGKRCEKCEQAATKREKLHAASQHERHHDNHGGKETDGEHCTPLLEHLFHGHDWCAKFPRGSYSMQLLAGYYAGNSTPNYDFGIFTARLGKPLNLPCDNKWLRGTLEPMLEFNGALSQASFGDYFFGSGLVLRYNFANKCHHLVPYVQVGAGVQYNDAYRTTSQNVIGQALNYTASAQAGMRWFIKPCLSLDVEGGYMHISNLGQATRNDGVGAVGGSVGLTYFFPRGRTYPRLDPHHYH